MKEISIFLCSPRAGGVTDGLAKIFGDAASRLGASVNYIPLRQYKIVPCIGCQACREIPWQCVLKNMDQTEEVFNILLASKIIVFASPIYFYALPAHFKALIDRSQRFWSRFQCEKEKGRKNIPVVALMSAGRARGEKLFDGALLTLRWFCKFLHLSLEEQLLYRGMDQPKDIAKKSDILHEIQASAQKWAMLENAQA